MSVGGYLSAGKPLAVASQNARQSAPAGAFVPPAGPHPFWDMVDVRGPDECWPWLGRRDRDGYGRAQPRQGARRKNEQASRVVVRIVHGVEPRVAQHSCDNPPCCNPRHVSDGTHASNAADKVAKGRVPRGEDAPAAKLTVPEVLAIRERWGAGEGGSALARDYCVTEATIRKIGRRQRWRHV